MEELERDASRQGVIFRRAHANDVPALFQLVNRAYSVETGSQGVSFKNSERFTTLSEVEDMLKLPGQEQEMIVAAASHGDDVRIFGCIYLEYSEDAVSFGPLAIDDSAQKKGYGSLLMRYAEHTARSRKLPYLRIKVVNWRTDVLPIYEAKGFKTYGTAPYDHSTHCDAAALTRPSHFLLLQKLLS